MGQNPPLRYRGPVVAGSPLSLRDRKGFPCRVHPRRRRDGPAAGNPSSGLLPAPARYSRQCRGRVPPPRLRYRPARRPRGPRPNQWRWPGSLKSAPPPRSTDALKTAGFDPPAAQSCPLPARQLFRPDTPRRHLRRSGVRNTGVRQCRSPSRRFRGCS